MKPRTETQTYVKLFKLNCRIYKYKLTYNTKRERIGITKRRPPNVSKVVHIFSLNKSSIQILHDYQASLQGALINLKEIAIFSDGISTINAPVI